MTKFQVKIKWGKEVFPDVEVDTSESPEVLKAQVFALTGVQPMRQKIMIKGTTLKEDSWDGIILRKGAMVLVMGSKDSDILQEPVKKTTFLEDMTEEEFNVALDLPVGIKNLGNTCYLNSVVQCLKSVPELHSALKLYQLQQHPAHNSMLALAMQDVFSDMDEGKTSFPLVFVNMFRTSFPRFSEQEGEGKYVQQDASECWVELIHYLQEILPPDSKEKVNEKFKKSLIDQYFCGELQCKWKCTESEEETETSTLEKYDQLNCHIATTTNYIQNGLLAKLEEQINKHSEVLGRNADYTKKSTITRLPAYLSVQMIRFFYKEKANVSAKVLKDVKFPLVLDVFDLCSGELKEKLIPVRQKYKIMDDKLIEEEKMLKRTGKVETEDYKLAPTGFSDDMGSNNSGFYELRAVLTHQGRTSSSGHYVAWIKFKPKEWLKCDDDIITPVTEEEILKLSGGGDWHTAYILLYGPRKLRVYEESKVEANDESESATVTPMEE